MCRKVVPGFENRPPEFSKIEVFLKSRCTFLKRRDFVCKKKQFFSESGCIFWSSGNQIISKTSISSQNLHTKFKIQNCQKCNENSRSLSPTKISDESIILDIIHRLFFWFAWAIFCPHLGTTILGGNLGGKQLMN